MLPASVFHGIVPCVALFRVLFATQLVSKTPSLFTFSLSENILNPSGVLFTLCIIYFSGFHPELPTFSPFGAKQHLQNINFNTDKNFTNNRSPGTLLRRAGRPGFLPINIRYHQIQCSHHSNQITQLTATGNMIEYR
jgi:hypothetical protein